YEDIDWCWRMHEAGWEVLLEPRAKVLHHLGGSSAPPSVVARAYRESFYRYCDLRGLWGLKAASRAGLAIRRLLGGRS
ncbi:glycosyltransferase family 2 protein, partial [Flavihumibacter cheonanensis]|uniref:glycosyltransferase family 2 protein n=1 Tax=Flavihumibacter cheonanensis TaxID=1442385 RepID=UPI001EF92406